MKINFATYLFAAGKYKSQWIEYIDTLIMISIMKVEYRFIFSERMTPIVGRSVCGPKELHIGTFSFI